jgi:hypothetical protein
MKKNIFSKRKWLFVLIAISILSACSRDFLDVVPIDRIPKEQFYKTEADLTSAIYGVYAAQRNMFTSWELALYNLEETRSDNTNQNYGRQSEHRAVDNFSVEAGNTSITGFWASAYDCINLCNAILDRAPAINMDETRKKQMMGEAFFIRSHAYFLLVQDYGGIPLRLHETVSFSNSDLAKATIEVVYTQIINDLQTASTTLPASYTGTGVGRATSYAAYTLLGKVLLQKGDKPAAATALRKVVFAGSPYSLLANYADLWTPGNKNSAESIFELQFLPPLNGCPFWNFFAPPALNVPGGINGGTSPNTPTLSLINSFEAGDTRLAASIGQDLTGRPYILKFKDAGVKSGNDANTNFPILRYADAKLMLAEALGETAEAYGLINEVRSRAHLGPISAATAGTFINKLMKERRVEFAFECQRWHDLLRLDQATAVSIMNTHLAQEFPTQSITIDAHDLLAPLPNTEGQTNKLVVQNPGYVPF